MHNLTTAEKDIVNEFRAFMIRNDLEFVTWEGDELRFIYLSNGENCKDLEKEGIFFRIEELASEIGIRTV